MEKETIAQGLYDERQNERWGTRLQEVIWPLSQRNRPVLQTWAFPCCEILGKSLNLSGLQFWPSPELIEFGSYLTCRPSFSFLVDMKQDNTDKSSAQLKIKKKVKTTFFFIIYFLFPLSDVTWLLLKGWAISGHLAAADCSAGFQGTRQMPSVAWHPCACVSLFSWPGVTRHQSRRPRPPALPRFLPSAVLGGEAAAASLDRGTPREKGRRDGGGGSFSRPQAGASGHKWVAKWKEFPSFLGWQELISIPHSLSPRGTVAGSK